MIVTDESSPVGIISEKDIGLFLLKDDTEKNLDQIPVSQIMNNLTSVNDSMSIEKYTNAEISIAGSKNFKDRCLLILKSSLQVNKFGIKLIGTFQVPYGYSQMLYFLHDQKLIIFAILNLKYRFYVNCKDSCILFLTNQI